MPTYPVLANNGAMNQFVGAFEVTSKLTGKVYQCRFSHMWNGPRGKDFFQTRHHAGTVRSYVRPLSAAWAAGLDEVRDARG